MNKNEAISKVESANISEWGWADEIIDSLDSMYARGYMNRYMEELGNAISSDDEEYRESIVEALNYDIWK